MVALKYKLPCILAAVTLVTAVKIKGADSAKYDLYNPSSDGTWTCLDGFKTIPHSAINDDYCDCIDGSDEPGTSACPNTMFYCENVGHIPAYIKSFAVNDGVCDEACCDGSDENGALITCPNRCKEVGEAYRKEQSSLKKSTEAGLAAKNKLIEEAEKQVALWEEQQSKLEDEIILKKSNLLRLQRELNDLESRSTSTKHKKKSKCQSGVIEVATLKHDIVILQKELNTLKNILGDMKRDHNHNYHDLAVKSAIAGYDEFLIRYDSIKADIEDNLQNIDVQEPEQDEEEEEEDSTTDDPVDEAVENARTLYQNAENEVNSLNTELEKIKSDLAFDYGADREWLKLKDVCVEKDEGEYTYSLCFLGDAYQKSNKDSTRTFLGKFNTFDGDDNNLYKVHTHTQGTRCWNGPERSVKAKIECGLENEILEVTEHEKCEYDFRMLSPAVCQTTTTTDNHKKDNTNKSTKLIHEEL